MSFETANIDTTNNKLSLEEVKKKLYLKYGICIYLRDEEKNKKYSLENIYVFVRDKLVYKHKKEFSCKLKDILYRNYYWIDSKYKMESKYENIKDVIEEGNYKKNNKDFGILCTMSDGYEIIFYPDYVNLKENKFLHYFDASWYCGSSCCPREWLQIIFDFFEESDEYTLTYYSSPFCEKDYD